MDDDDWFNLDPKLGPEGAEISRLTGRPKEKPRGRPFVKGDRGNPAGRPKVEGIKDVRSMARRYTQLAIDTLVEIMANPDEKSNSRVTAATVILDRGWGKAPQHVVVDGEVDVTGLDDANLNEVTKRELASYLGNVIKRAGKEEDSEIIN